MAEFVIKKENFSKFLEVCSMVGTIQFRDKKAIKNPLFSTFYLTVGDGVLEVLTVDPYRKKTDAQFIKRDVITNEEGIIPILEQKALADCLKGKGITGLISVSNKGSIVTLETERDVYEIRQKGVIFLEELKPEKKAETLQHLSNWKEWHQFEKDGLLIMHYVGKTKAGKEIKKDVPYPMKLRIKKDELLKIVGDTLNIMKDNKTRLVFENGVFKAFKGEENAKIKSKHQIEYDNLLPEQELFDFDEEFYNIQSIIPNLFDIIEMNVRRIKANNTIAIFIRSIDEKSKIEANIGLVSIVRGSKEEKSS